MKSDDIILFIINRRKQLGISQHDIAFKLGYTNQLVSNWENGKSIPDLVSIDLPSTLTSIGDRAFDSEYFMNVDIPEGVTYLGEDILRNNDGAYIVVPKSVTTWKLTSTLLLNITLK